MKRLFLLLILILLIAGCTSKVENKELFSDANHDDNVMSSADNVSDDKVLVESNDKQVESNDEQIVEDNQVVELDDKKEADNCSKFNYPPVNLDKVEFITPLGQMESEHVLPTDHQYYYGSDETAEIEVYAPADGMIRFVQHMTQPVTDPGNVRVVDDYLVQIEHKCSLTSAYIHIDYPIKEIVDAVSGKDYVYADIPVKAGDLIGTYTYSVDYNVFDKNVNNSFVIPESYSVSRFLEVKDPFDYFNDEIKKKLELKSLRSVEPLGGKIDYDVDGKLVGNWFEENTNKFAGLKMERYWAGHLSFVYNHIDPSLVMISIGTFEENKADQFAVKNNMPDPASVTIDSGLVKYELVDYQYFVNGKSWDRKSLAKPITAKPSSQSHGVVLVKMIDNKRIKVELFPGKTASSVTDFTNNAKFYVR